MTEEKKELKSLSKFHSANKINNYNRGGEQRGKKKKIEKNLQKPNIEAEVYNNNKKCDD